MKDEREEYLNSILRHNEANLIDAMCAESEEINTMKDAIGEKWVLLDVEFVGEKKNPLSTALDDLDTLLNRNDALLEVTRSCDGYDIIINRCEDIINNGECRKDNHNLRKEDFDWYVNHPTDHDWDADHPGDYDDDWKKDEDINWLVDGTQITFEIKV